MEFRNPLGTRIAPTTAIGAEWRAVLLPPLRQWLLWLGLPLLLLIPVMPPLSVPDSGYLALHSIMEAMAVAVASLVFVIGWSLYPRTRGTTSLLVGCGFLAVAIFDLAHLLSHAGMPFWLTPGSVEKGIAFWLAARYTSALVLLLAVSSAWRVGGRPGLRPLALGLTLAVCIPLVPAIAHGIEGASGLFFVAGQGLTPLNIAAEYVLIALFVAALLIVALRPPPLAPLALRPLVLALLSMIASESLLSLNGEPADLFNFAGHACKVIAYYQLYQALFVGMVCEPFRRMEEAEKALRHSEAGLSALFEAAPDGVMVVDALSRIVLVNPAAADMFGYDAGEMKGMSHHRLLPERMRGEHARLAADYFAEPAARLMGGSRRFHAQRRDGREFPAEVALSPVILGGRRHVIATVRDITVHEQVERSLEASEARTRSFLDNSVDWVWEVDATGLFTYSSNSVQTLFGLAPAEVIGRSPLNFMSEAEAGRFGPIWREQFMRQEPMIRVECNYRHGTGRALTLETSASPFFDGGGRFLGYRGTSRDVTLSRENRRALAESEQRFRILFEHSPIGMGIADLEGRILYVNDTLSAMFGYTEEELRALTVQEIAHPEDYRASQPRREAMLEGRAPGFSADLRYRCRDGRYLWTQATVTLGRNGKGQPDHLLAQIRDISAERENRLRAERMLALIDGSDECIVFIGRDTGITYLNPCARRLLGLREDEDAGGLILSDCHPPEMTDLIFNWMLPQADRAGVWRGEILWRARSGEDVPVWQTVMAHKDEAGEVDYWSVVARDQRERQQFEARLQYQDTHDALTALPNQALVRDRFQQALVAARRRNRLVAVLLVDLDDFRRINDTLGHAAGDAILLETALRLQHTLQEGDTLTRRGGDEFVILLPDAELVQDIVAVADRINDALAAPVRIRDREVFLTASIGASVFPFDHDDIDELLRKAEVAMYRAKEVERGGCRFYTADMDHRYREDLDVEAALRRAIERNELLLYYQPKFHLADGRLGGFEALMRWQHPEQGMIPPGRFIPIAERSNLIVDLGEWALRTACLQMAAWRRQGFETGRMAVNVSALQFEHGDLVATVQAVLAETGLPAERLELEVTESVLMHDPAAASRILESLKSMGVSIAVDDFGTGYSSLSYLRRFPVDVLKIDRSFVAEIGADADAAAIVHAIVSMAHVLGIHVVAEGIETPEQQDYLRDCHCDLAQGYLTGRPVDAEAARSFLAPARQPAADVEA
ncbi:MAG: PAS domain S-box protein [Candidatus Nitricoxidivorans perseverans]|uniref:PAS domain S-box protein n=1 Tax=Candidatus Nitricoxidivorans perseverans TaxID=2975601 RepID=A0AA49FN17_9PROT|nr:MAG: PAS domain S-box protein [Candidatus Nitricoxidivorans perseverans]